MLCFEAFAVRNSSHRAMLSLLARRMVSTASTATSSAAADVDHWQYPDWHGAIEVVIAAPVEKVWHIASDWLSFPRKLSVECAEGQNGVPGCVRKLQAPNSNFWVAEKLTGIDHTSRILSYDLVGGNSGIEIGYKAAFQVSAIVTSPIVSRFWTHGYLWTASPSAVLSIAKDELQPTQHLPKCMP